MSTLRETFLSELTDIYDAEKQLIKALPKMAKAAENDELREGFEQHLQETETHVQRLDEVFQAFEEKARGKKCKAMKGLLEEGKELIEEQAADAALIAAAQKVEHYEMASYGSLKAWAELLGEQGAADLLEQTLEEEKATDEKLTALAETTINAEETEEEHAKSGDQ
jgi:ferritin-like metal-binding protein YciE